MSTNIGMARESVCLAISYINVSAQSLGDATLDVPNMRYAERELNRAVEHCSSASREFSWDETPRKIDLKSIAVHALDFDPMRWVDISRNIERVGLSTLIESVGIDLDRIRNYVAYVGKMIEQMREGRVERILVMNQICQIEHDAIAVKKTIIALLLIAEIIDAIKRGELEACGVKIVPSGAVMTDLGTRKVVFVKTQ